MSAVQPISLTPVTAFDELAADYDCSFTQSRIGALMRQAVWRRLDASFRPGDCVLELNCGTGEDALHLTQRGVNVFATDVSMSMLEIASDKINRAGLCGKVTTGQLDLNSRDWAARIGDVGVGNGRHFVPRPDRCGERSLQARSLAFDGAFSNFGGLNCVDDLHSVSRELSTLVVQGGRVLLCVMGPLVVWEWVWHLLKLQPAKAFRRLRCGGVQWRGMRIRYPSIATLRRTFAPEFKFVQAMAVGALVPPSYAEPWARRHPRALSVLDAIERHFETSSLLTSLADHYLVELEKSA